MPVAVIWARSDLWKVPGYTQNGKILLSNPFLPILT